MGIKLDSSSRGLGMILKDYQEEALRYLWKVGEGSSSRYVWTNVNEGLAGRRTISRASVINFLNEMVEEGVLSYPETTGKVGHKRIYSTVLNEADFKEYVAKTVLGNLARDFPEATRQVIRAHT